MLRVGVLLQAAGARREGSARDYRQRWRDVLCGRRTRAPACEEKEEVSLRSSRRWKRDERTLVVTKNDCLQMVQMMFICAAFLRE